MGYMLRLCLHTTIINTNNKRHLCAERNTRKGPFRQTQTDPRERTECAEGNSRQMWAEQADVPPCQPQQGNDQRMTEFQTDDTRKHTVGVERKVPLQLPSPGSLNLRLALGCIKESDLFTP